MRYIAIKNSQAKLSKRDDPRFYLPREFNKEKYGSIQWCPLSNLAVIHDANSTITPSREPDREFNYIDLADIDEIEGEIVQIHKKKGSEIKGGKRPILPGDVVFARIEPSIFNRKYAHYNPEIPEKLEEDEENADNSGVEDQYICIGSTELFVARPKKGVSSIYLHWALRGDWVAEQLSPGILTGSTGRRRLSKDDFAALLIPDLSSEEQIEIESMILSGRSKRNEYLTLADAAITESEIKILNRLTQTSPYIESEEERKDDSETQIDLFGASK